jgi:hypothetical protein
MKDISRRKLIMRGLAATAGVSGLGVAARIAQRYGLIPPDHGGIYGLGETLTYASQRLLTRHSLAREFSRSQISKRPLANEMPPLNEAFKRLQAGGFADWRLSIDGMVDRLQRRRRGFAGALPRSEASILGTLCYLGHASQRQVPRHCGLESYPQGAGSTNGPTCSTPPAAIRVEDSRGTALADSQRAGVAGRTEPLVLREDRICER